jgi:hypothetical protein
MTLFPSVSVHTSTHGGSDKQLAQDGVAELTKNDAKTRADAAFRRKEDQAREGVKAMVEYQAARAAEGEKTARLRALRLARDAEAKAQQGTEEPTKRQTRKRSPSPA